MCPVAHAREEVLSGRFANLLQDLVIPPAILEWLGDVVLDSDRSEQAARAESIKKLKGRYDQIEARIETMYLDKLDGRIAQEFFDKQAATMRREQGGLLRKIQDIEKAVPAPVDQAIDMLRLTSRASELFLQQPAAEQRRLLQTVVEKAAWKGGILQTALFEPFEVLRHSNQESYRKEKEKAGSGREMGIWLAVMDSNWAAVPDLVGLEEPRDIGGSPLPFRYHLANFGLLLRGERRSPSPHPAFLSCAIEARLGSLVQHGPFEFSVMRSSALRCYAGFVVMQSHTSELAIWPRILWLRTPHVASRFGGQSAPRRMRIYSIFTYNKEAPRESAN